MGVEREPAETTPARCADDPYDAPRVDDLGEVESLTLGSLQDA